MIPKRCIIIGSGASIRKGMFNKSISDIPLWENIKNEFTLSANWNFKWFIPTAQIFVDHNFYITEQKNLSKLPLVFGSQSPYYGKIYNKIWSDICHLPENIYLLKRPKHYFVGKEKCYYWGTDAWKNGFWKFLSGIMGMILAIACGCNELFLCGFDATETEGRTHFYQGEPNVGTITTEYNQKNTGVGKDGNHFNTVAYNNDINKYFKWFKPELKRLSIYNVSPESKINIFPKISYDEFYKIIKKKPNKILQKNIRISLINLYCDKYGVKNESI